MASFILGRIDLDSAVADDVAQVQAFPTREEYDEYSSGLWQSCSLWNASGDAEDALYRDFSGPLLQTEYGRMLPAIDELLGETFSFDHLKMVRTRNLVDGIVIPHRDFLEIPEGRSRCFRVLMCLEDNPQAFHSDEDGVFRMRAGEVWYLDASLTHAAANFSTDSRVALCLDYIFPGSFEPADVFVDPSRRDTDLAPTVPHRDPVPAAFDAALDGLSHVLTHETFREVAFLLAKLHFRFDVAVDACYDWLLAIASRTGDPELVEKTRLLRRYLVDDRQLGQRFSFSQRSAGRSAAREAPLGTAAQTA